MAAPVWTPRTPVTLTATWASLAASSTLVAGYCTASYDNTSNNDPALVLSGFFRTGSANLAAGLIEVWAFTQRDGSAWPDLFTSAYSGSAGAFTVRSRQVLQAGAFNVATIVTETTQRTWDIRKRDIVGPFRGVDRVAFFVTHNAHTTTSAWSSTEADHGLILTPFRWV